MRFLIPHCRSDYLIGMFVRGWARQCFSKWDEMYQGPESGPKEVGEKVLKLADDRRIRQQCNVMIEGFRGLFLRFLGDCNFFYIIRKEWGIYLVFTSLFALCSSKIKSGFIKRKFSTTIQFQKSSIIGRAEYIINILSSSR